MILWYLQYLLDLDLKKTIRIPLSCWNGVTWSLIGTIILSPLGEAKIYGISSFNAVRVLGNVTYVI